MTKPYRSRVIRLAEAQPLRQGTLDVKLVAPPARPNLQTPHEQDFAGLCVSR